MTRKSKLFWLMLVIFLAFDQATKLWIYANLEMGPRGDIITVIPGFFDLVHAENPGAAFSMFHTFEYRHLLFLGFTAIAGWVVWDQYRRLKDDDTWMPIALGLIASGALGNAIDRVWKRTVTDFLRIYTDAPDAKAWLIDTFGTNEWPSFNIADSALLVGVVIFVIAGYIEERAEKAAAAAASAE